VEGVLFSVTRKLDMATALKERMEDRRLRLPVGNSHLRQDLHSVQRIAGPTGAPRLIAERSDNGHADRFWAIALGTAAAHQPRVPIEFKSAGQRTAAGLPFNRNWDGFHG
jgi:phage FluMu gp28-like protein